MKKKDWLYIVVFIIVLGGVIFFASFKQEGEHVPLDEQTATTTEDGLDEEEGEETSERIPQEYFDALTEARELTRSEKYDQALVKIEEALVYYQGSQAYVTKATVYDFMRNYAGVRDAMYEVVYTFGVLDSRYYRKYIDALIQTGASSAEVAQVYEDGISKIAPLADTIGKGHLIDLYTGYAGFLEGQGDYAGAIRYLELALALNPSQAEIIRTQIEALRAKI